MNRVLIAMSGGVDSSVAAHLIRKQGYSGIGATMLLYSHREIHSDSQHSCCSLRDIEDARSVAFGMNMPHYVFNFKDAFREHVLHPFAREYEQGVTPNPCISCNQHMKFDKLLTRAFALNIRTLATGHYARIVYENGRYLLKKALDTAKDQSYVLYAMTQKQLAHTKFPLGSMQKSDVRQIALEQGFVNAKKHDSQDICFVENGDYAATIEQLHGRHSSPGDFVSKEGTVLGKHKGIIRYTIGQRRGLGISAPHPLYVIEKCANTNTIVLGDSADLYHKELYAANFNWIAFESPPALFRAKARIRYHHAEQWATIESTEEGNVHIIFDEPQRAIAKGQAVVLYQDDWVLGGGIIL